MKFSASFLAVLMSLTLSFAASAAPGDGTLTPVKRAHIKRKPPQTIITPEHPLIILQTSNRFADTTEDWNFKAKQGEDPYEAARAHGRETVRVWKDTVPADIRPYCQFQIELRLRDHEERYKRLRCLLEETQNAGVPISLQISDPHDTFIIDPIYVDKLLDEFSCIKSVGITESRTEHYATFNVPRYAVFPDALYAMDIIQIAAKHGVHVSMSYQMLKWMHITTDELNRPLLETIEDYKEYILPQNEHLLAQHVTRQTSTWGTWLAGMVDNWGVEPQSWWYENGRMLSPGVFGKTPKGPDQRAEVGGQPMMPPGLYRAMILEGAKMGATVYQFEPFWDLYDYASSQCWRDVIYPTLMEVINNKLIPTRNEVMDKVKVAYHLNSAKSIRELHASLRDVDYIADEGLLARAAYGVWDQYLQHELIPNKGQYYYIPLLPPTTSKNVLGQFAKVIEPDSGATEGDFVTLLNQYYPKPDGEGTACIMSIGGHTYVMQSQENLYERQTYAIDLPKPVRGVKASMTAAGLALEWTADPGAKQYHIQAAKGVPSDINVMSMPEILTTKEKHLVIPKPEAGICYSVSATTSTIERREGTVNYLDYLVFNQHQSVPAELISLGADGAATVQPVPVKEDTRPASQVVYPTFEGADGAYISQAKEIVNRLDALKQAHDTHDLDGLIALYSDAYLDGQQITKPVIRMAWRNWMNQSKQLSLMRQIRQWDFAEYETARVVRVRMFSCFEGVVIDQGQGWSRYDTFVRTPRTDNEEVTYTWKQEADGVWRIVNADPSVPALFERR